MSDRGTALTKIDPAHTLPAPFMDLGKFDLMHRFAVAMSDSSLVPDALTMTGVGDDRTRLPEKTIVANCFMVVELAYRWQMSPFAAAQCVSIVHGRICVEGKLVHAVLEALLGVRLKYALNDAQGDALAVTVSGTLPGEDEPRTVTGTAGQWKTTNKGSPWLAQANWPRQLRYRGAREWARAHAPGALLGVYTPDEVDDPGANARDITPLSGPAIAPPDIPDTPAVDDPPPPALAPAAPAISDADFLASLDTDMATAATPDQLMEHVVANQEEVDERGVEQVAAELAQKHAARIKAANPEHDYRNLVTAMRAAAMLAELGDVWKAGREAMAAMPERWRKELAAEKDRLKAKLQGGKT